MAKTILEKVKIYINKERNDANIYIPTEFEVSEEKKDVDDNEK